MTSPPQHALRNLLLRRMSADDYALLAPHLERVELPRSMPLFHCNAPAAHAYFIESAIGSVLAISPEGQRVEAGLFGRDGFGPTALAVGDDRSPFEGTVQVPDGGHRIAAGPFRAALDASASLRGLMQRFSYVFGIQTGFTALSNAVHGVHERLARWILMCDDRRDGGTLPLTHEFLSIMLAVRRPSVTTALHVLEGNRLIHAERGLVTIRNRAALEEFAGDAYGGPEREYERLIGPLRPQAGRRGDREAALG